MKARQVIGVILAALLAAPAGAAWAAPPKADPGPGGGSCSRKDGGHFHHHHGMDFGMMGGMMGGMGMMGGPMMSMGPIWKLDLSDDQLAKVRTIHQEMMTQSLELHGKVLEAQAQLPKLYAATPMDAAAIGKVYSRIFDLYQQMIRNRIKAHNQVTALLNPDQRKRYERWRSGMMMMEGHGMMGDMGHGMGPGMGPGTGMTSD